MTKECFDSVLGKRLTEFIAFRRSVGFDYRSQVHVLLQFDRVVREEMCAPGPVTRDLVEAYLRKTSRLRPLTRRVRLSIVRQFLLYLRQHEPETFIPERSLLPGGAAPRPPHIYTEKEIQALLRESLRFPTRYPRRRWLLHHTLIGLLYVTGLRISEALALTLADVDLCQRTVRVRRTKFHKSRIVPLATSSCAAVKRYLVERAEKGHATTSTAPLFVSINGGPLPYSTALGAFHKISRMAGVRGPPGTRGPRIHDLRHTAAVRRLYLWYREGKDVQALLPVLVTYLGHSAVRYTEVYLTATSELLAQASERFEERFPLNDERRGETPS